MTNEITLGLDRPLVVGSACDQDRLGRKAFSTEAVSALRNVSSTSGFVLSIEGAWGSGKTSTLAMVEEQLRKSSPESIVVHFNPWLVGDRDALLLQFLKKVSSAISLQDNQKLARELIKRLDAYSLAFELLKMAPGGEVTAQFAKSFLGFYRKKKTDELEHLGGPETKKAELALALASSPNPIVVFIDDIDRLYPKEVYEMVRIIKSVGDLPNVGYVVAWDHKYVTAALANISVPFPAAYLDKVIQLRMPLPSLSASSRSDLVNQAMALIPTEATQRQFTGDIDRFTSLYYVGLRDMLEHPRDIVRVFNSIKVIEPSLRGEIAFPDIVGLVTLMIKAQPVFELLCKHPQWFSGLEKEAPRSTANVAAMQAGKEALERVITDTDNPRATRSLVQFLFPLIVDSDDEEADWIKVSAEGHIADPVRLKVALQRSISSAEISIVTARKYLSEPSKRTEISNALTSENCVDFLETLGDIARSSQGKGITEVDALYIDIARLPDTSPFLAHRHLSRSTRIGPEGAAERAITEIVKSTKADGTKVAAKIAEDPMAISVAAYLLSASYLDAENASASPLRCALTIRQQLFNRLAANIRDAVTENRLVASYTSGFTLSVLARGNPESCRQIFEAMRTVGDSALDVLVLTMSEDKFLLHGQTYAPPQKDAPLMAYCSVDELHNIAVSRLTDPMLGYPTRAAWRAILDNKALYFDGTDAGKN
jgi:ABC-type lipopolysaccharide export system ATPase subunit